jgi:ureidoglycolate lyase
MTLCVKPLTMEAFKPYGTFGALTPPTDAPLVGGDIISFWPDCGGVLNLGPDGNNQVSLGICQTAWRPLAIDVCEFHTCTGEGILPLDGDIYLHVGPATGDDTIPALEVFRVPQGTAVLLKPGVWHHAPFAVKPGDVVNSVIILPQRTYANDCIVRNVEPAITFAEE